MIALPIILVPWRQRQEVSEFSGSFSYREGHRGSSLKCQCGVLSTSSLSSSQLLVEIETETSWYQCFPKRLFLKELAGGQFISVH